MKNPRTTKNVARNAALAVVAFLGLSAGPAAAYPGLPSPSMEVTANRSSQSGSLVCAVSQTLLPAGANGILVRISVPRDSALRSVLLKTASGELPLDLIESMPIVGEYETIIDNQKTNCATSGTLYLDVEGDLENNTATCPEVLLPKASSCE